MVFSDFFKIITNMDIFQYNELTKKCKLKATSMSKRKKRKESQMSFKKSTLVTKTNDDKDEKPSQHKH